MQIRFQTPKTINSPIANISLKTRQNAPLKANFNKKIMCDTINFTALKKAQFKGIDNIVVEKFKAPIEKFNSLKDFQTWSDDMANSIINKDFKGRQPQTKEQRKNLFKEWYDYLLFENKEYSNAARLLILNAITKELKPNNDALPPVLNKGVLANCIDEIENEAQIEKNYQPNFKKMYETKLRAQYFNDEIIEGDETGWVIIPSRKNDPEHFEENVEKLKSLSHKNWCTKSYNAAPYLTQGDFHIYLENSNPKLGVRFIGNKIEEIQGELNNSRIPVLYSDEIMKYIKENKLDLSKNAQKEIEVSKELIEKVKKIKKDLKTAIKNNDTVEILKYFGIEVQNIDKDGFLTISHFAEPKGFTYTDCGIDENKLLEKVKKINEGAWFQGFKATNLKNLEYIGGNACFEKSKITNLESLKYIGRSAYFADSPITNLDNLEYIGENACFGNSKIKNLKNLKHIGQGAYFEYLDGANVQNLKTVGMMVDLRYSKNINLESLKNIKGNAFCERAQNINLKNLRSIEGYAYFFEGKNINLENIQFIEDADFEKSQTVDLRNLQTINGKAIFKNSQISDLKNLQTINGDANFKGSNIKDIKHINIKGNVVKWDAE